MPASISSVTTMGFSNGTFNGSIALVVTLGYGIGAAAVAPPPQDGWVATAMGRVVPASQFNRVVVAYPERR